MTLPTAASLIARGQGLLAAIVAELDGKEPNLSIPTQAEAEAGTATTGRKWTAQRIAQAIAAQVGSDTELVAGTNITLTPGTGTLTISAAATPPGVFGGTLAEARTTNTGNGSTVSQTIPITAFTTINLPVEDTDPGSNFDPTTSIYTVPTTGLYMCTGRVRIVDETPDAQQFGLGIHSSSADNPAFQWGLTVYAATPGGSRRRTYSYQRVASFTAGQQLRLFAFGSQATGIAVAQMTVVRIA